MHKPAGEGGSGGVFALARAVVQDRGNMMLERAFLEVLTSQAAGFAPLSLDDLARRCCWGMVFPAARKTQHVLHNIRHGVVISLPDRDRLDLTRKDGSSSSSVQENVVE
jgi:hypothetical protein